MKNPIRLDIDGFMSTNHACENLLMGKWMVGGMLKRALVWWVGGVLKRCIGHWVKGGGCGLVVWLVMADGCGHPFFS